MNTTNYEDPRTLLFTTEKMWPESSTMDMKRSCHNHYKRFSDGKIEQMITGVNGNRIVCILICAIGLIVLHII
jgi:hypothetical protein